MPTWQQILDRRARAVRLRDILNGRGAVIMPCRDEIEPAFEPRAKTTAERIIAEHRQQGAMLCALMSALQRQELLGQALEFYDEKESGVPIQELRDWWERHQREDVERRKRERIHKEKKLAEVNAAIEKATKAAEKLRLELEAYE